MKKRSELGFDDFVALYHKLMFNDQNLVEWGPLISYSKTEKIVSLEEFKNFLIKEQEDQLGNNNQGISRFIRDYLQDSQRDVQEPYFTFSEFVSFLFSKQNDIWDNTYDQVLQDMTRPLSHYWIASSHNTYVVSIPDWEKCPPPHMGLLRSPTQDIRLMSPNFPHHHFIWSQEYVYCQGDKCFFHRGYWRPASFRHPMAYSINGAAMEFLLSMGGDARQMSFGQLPGNFFEFPSVPVEPAMILVHVVEFLANGVKTRAEVGLQSRTVFNPAGSFAGSGNNPAGSLSVFVIFPAFMVFLRVSP